MSDDLIKRSDVLSMIDAFERDFQQSWRGQLRANIYAIPSEKGERIEQLEAACWRMQQERDRAIGWRDSDQSRAEAAEEKLAKAVEAVASLIEIGDRMAESITENYYLPKVATSWRKARTTLAELEGEE